MVTPSFQILDADDQADLSKASLSLQLSSTGFDEDKQEFHVSLDRAIFQDPIAIISKVLEANGFATNLENLLACLDQFKVAALVKLNSRQSSPYPIAKTYLPCFKFQLPSKTVVGNTLRRFYDEIESYELAISELRNLTQAPISRTIRKKEADSDRLIALEEENKMLKKELDDFKLLLNRAVKSEATANQALASQNLLPNNIRLAVVRELNIDDRQILLKSGRTSINISMALSNILPNIDDKCLVHFEDGSAKGCFFYQSTGIVLRPILSEILAIDTQICKVRDINRRTWCIDIKNEDESNLLNGLSRGDHLHLYVVDQKILRFESLVPYTDDYCELVHDSLARHQISKLMQKMAENSK